MGFKTFKQVEFHNRVKVQGYKGVYGVFAGGSTFAGRRSHPFQGG